MLPLPKMTARSRATEGGMVHGSGSMFQYHPPHSKSLHSTGNLLRPSQSIYSLVPPEPHSLAPIGARAWAQAQTQAQAAVSVILHLPAWTKVLSVWNFERSVSAGPGSGWQSLSVAMVIIIRMLLTGPHC